VTYGLEQLTAGARWPAGVDPTVRESYLSDREFEEVFGGTAKGDFYRLPRWKQLALKKEVGLF